jgi:hypothetical protein
VDGRCASPRVGGMNADVAVSPTLFRHEGVIAQLGFHSPIMPSDGIDVTASAAGSRLVAMIVGGRQAAGHK